MDIINNILEIFPDDIAYNILRKLDINIRKYFVLSSNNNSKVIDDIKNELTINFFDCDIINNISMQVYNDDIEFMTNNIKVHNFTSLHDSLHYWNFCINIKPILSINDEEIKFKLKILSNINFIKIPTWYDAYLNNLISKYNIMISFKQDTINDVIDINMQINHSYNNSFDVIINFCIFDNNFVIIMQGTQFTCFDYINNDIILHNDIVQFPKPVETLIRIELITDTKFKLVFNDESEILYTSNNFALDDVYKYNINFNLRKILLNLID